MTKGGYQQQQAVPEPLPAEDEHTDFEGWSVLLTAVTGLIIAVTGLIGAIKGKKKFSAHVEKRRETNPEYLTFKKKNR
jgi:hypothetical protein